MKCKCGRPRPRSGVLQSQKDVTNQALSSRRGAGTGGATAAVKKARAQPDKMAVADNTLVEVLGKKTAELMEV